MIATTALILGAVLVAPSAHALQLTVAWDNNASGATGFKVERSVDGSSFSEIATVDVTSTTYTDSNLGSGSYSYRVRAFDATSYSDYSNVAAYSTDSIPVITSQPVSASVIVGSPVTFSVAADGSPAPTFQWLKDGVAIAGATASTLSINTTAFSDGGTYTVIASNRAGSVTSSGATLTVKGIAPAFSTQPASQSVAAGSDVTFTVAVTGNPTPTLQWTKNGANISGATGSTLTLPSVSSSDAATYAVIATNSVAAVASQDATLTVTTNSTLTSSSGSTTSSTSSATTTVPGHLANVSIRAIPGKGASQAVSMDFAVSAFSKTVLVRGIGPGLASFTTAPTMSDPKLSLYDGGTLVASNSSWGGSAALVSLFAQVGAFPLATNSKDAALVTTLVPKLYTASLSGKSDGIGMVEIYNADLAATLGGRFAKVIGHAPVGTGEGVLIAGFTITGDTALHVVIRAVGPSLGIKGSLADPQLSLYSGTALVVRNDNWGGSSALSSLFAQVGASSLPTTSKDSAIDVTLQPGTYSAVVSGVGLTTGLANLEFYEVP